MAELLMNTSEVAEELHTSKAHVYKMMREEAEFGKLFFRMRKRSQWLIRRKDFIKYIEKFSTSFRYV